MWFIVAQNGINIANKNLSGLDFNPEYMQTARDKPIKDNYLPYSKCDSKTRDWAYQTK